MKILWSEKGWLDYLYWQDNDKRIVLKINDLIKEIQRSPFTGTGKPEPLRGDLTSWWSRRITVEHRFIYQISGTNDQQVLNVASCRFHYGKTG